MTKETTASSTEPWRGLPPSVADVLEPELPSISAAIIAAIAEEVPEYARPLEGAFGRGLRTGITQALSQFVALVRDPDAGRAGREVYVGLGRGELRQGRTLDSLLSAYRVGARVAWRQISAVAREAGLDTELISLLAESIFAYIDELSADSVEGYAQARSEIEGERERRRRELVVLMLREPPVEEPDLRAAAKLAGFSLPRRAAALCCADSELRRLVRGLGNDAIAATIDGLGCAIVGDPGGPGRREQLERAAEGQTAALGPTGPVGELRDSWRLACSALGALEAGAIAASGLVDCDQILVRLLCFEGRGLIARISERRLEALASLTPRARRRMEETALAYVQRGGNAVAIASSLQIHPQTARYRIARLRELLGEDLDDPDARLELELALRDRG
jgi:hypothetical protein